MSEEAIIERLEPCPFCGGEQITTAPDRTFGDTTWAVVCRACGANVVRDAEAAAVAAWNRRSVSPELDQLRAAKDRAEQERDEWEARAHRYERQLGVLGRDLSTAEAALSKLREEVRGVLEPFSEAYHVAFSGLSDSISVRLDASFKLQNKDARCITKPATLRVGDFHQALSLLSDQEGKTMESQDHAPTTCAVTSGQSQEPYR